MRNEKWRMKWIDEEMEEEEEEEERLKPDCQTMPNSQPQNFHSDK